MKKIVACLSLFLGLFLLTSCATGDAKAYLEKFANSEKYTIVSEGNKIVYDKGNIYMDISVSVIKMELYVINEDDVANIYVKGADGKWMKLPSLNASMSQMIAAFDEMKKEAKKYFEQFDLFELNDQNQYVGKADSIFKDIKLYMEGGKLVIEETMMGQTTKSTIELAGKVVLPKEAKE